MHCAYVYMHVCECANMSVFKGVFTYYTCFDPSWNIICLCFTVQHQIMHYYITTVSSPGVVCPTRPTRCSNS